MGKIVKSLFGGGAKIPAPDNSAIIARQAEQDRKLQAQEEDQRKQKSSLAAVATGAAGKARQTVSLRTGKSGVQTKLGTQT